MELIEVLVPQYGILECSVLVENHSGGVPPGLGQGLRPGLSRLRKKAIFQANSPKNIPQGLKPGLYFEAFAALFGYAQGRLRSRALTHNDAPRPECALGNLIPWL